MAQDTWINVTVDSRPTTADGSQHGHTSARGGSASGDVTLSFDKTKVATRTRLQWAVKEALRQVEAGGELKP